MGSSVGASVISSKLFKDGNVDGTLDIKSMGYFNMDHYMYFHLHEKENIY